eukprot:CAMPEP_0181046662 /NCGR_PEP_ID=MMETSP1070-20121207/14465_1 /TAXON_ID=265543 /ORGANISM="Minutocellus polymorphus, Strain NH13" /LENGTH=315 /DNA_ID=CAMNT_0023125281 /DNA_START=1 /DNA_END=948 /DNA_ORIENTATION=+
MVRLSTSAAALLAASSAFSISSANAFAPLSGATATSLSSDKSVDLSDFLSDKSGSGYNMLICGTYAADFNAIEYAQRLRYYLPKLQEAGVGKVGFLLNCKADAAKALCDYTDLPMSSPVDILIDPLGKAGRQFGVGRGWKPDDEELFGVFTKKYSPYIKLFGMLWGLGAWATLPAVIGGYVGNPFTPQPWIEDALAVGQKKGRWPDNALELDEEGNVLVNKFSELPVVGKWERRPLELATLRLQNMVDISIKNWEELAPERDALDAGVLTQLGGCVIIDPSNDDVLYQWEDPGICAVANFEDVLEKLTKGGEDEE